VIRAIPLYPAQTGTVAASVIGVLATAILQKDVLGLLRLGRDEEQDARSDKRPNLRSELDRQDHYLCMLRFVLCEREKEKSIPDRRRTFLDALPGCFVGKQYQLASAPLVSALNKVGHSRHQNI